MTTPRARMPAPSRRAKSLAPCIEEARRGARWAQAWRRLRSCLALGVRFAILLLLIIASPAQGSPQSIAYLLDLREPATHLVRVTMTVREAPPRTEIQFPAWNNLYQIRDFVRNVQELRAECDGRPQELERVDLQTWRSGAESCSTLTLRYAVFASQEGPYSSDLSADHAFLNFALLLLYLPRERGHPLSLRFLLPPGWKLATLLEEGAAAEGFRAASYDALADSPAEAGGFQEYTYAQGGATYRVVVHAESADYSAQRLLASLKKITAAETALMHDVPFSRYTFIFHFPRQGGGGGMEHSNGTAITVSARDLRDNWGALEDMAAHEFFHLWNVKRIRPQTLEPIDYTHGNDTRDLWFCEGVTSTYAQLCLLRAGLMTRALLYARLAVAIQTLEGRPARHFQSVELAGREAWFEKYTDYLRPERSISYYNKGELLGFLLDLAIRHASRNQASLDDVMRRLNTDFARRNRFHTEADLRALIAQLAPTYTGLDAFFRDDVRGTRELEYDTALNYAGLRLVRELKERPTLDFHTVRKPDGSIQIESLEEGGSAQRAGLERGDLLVKMDGRTLAEPLEDLLPQMRAGQRVKLQVRRQSRTVKLEYALGAQRQTSYRVEELPHPNPEQLRVREGWLRGETARREAGKP